MVWGGYAVLMSGKTDSITKLNNNPGCLPGSTFVYSEVFKLEFSSASTHLKSSLIPILAFSVNILLGSVFMNYGPPQVWPSSKAWSWQELVVAEVAAEVLVWVLKQPGHPHQ
ncbi:hypothetical protein Tco_1436030 [Tanacetum coccineum]